MKLTTHYLSSLLQCNVFSAHTHNKQIQNVPSNIYTHEPMIPHPQPLWAYFLIIPVFLSLLPRKQWMASEALCAFVCVFAHLCPYTSVHALHFCMQYFICMCPIRWSLSISIDMQPTVPSSYTAPHGDMWTYYCIYRSKVFTFTWWNGAKWSSWLENIHTQSTVASQVCVQSAPDIRYRNKGRDKTKFCNNMATSTWRWMQEWK